MDKIQFYIQNKRIAQIISKTYNIDYEISQKIVDIVFNETVRTLTIVNKKRGNKLNE